MHKTSRQETENSLKLRKPSEVTLHPTRDHITLYRPWPVPFNRKTWAHSNVNNVSFIFTVQTIIQCTKPIGSSTYFTFKGKTPPKMSFFFLNFLFSGRLKIRSIQKQIWFTPPIFAWDRLLDPIRHHIITLDYVKWWIFWKWAPKYITFLQFLISWAVRDVSFTISLCIS